MTEITNKNKRIMLFLLGCIPARILLVYIAKHYQISPWRELLILFTTIVSIGFLTIYLFGLRKTGSEVFGDVIWWNNLRPVHGLLYGLFAYIYYKNHDYAWKILGIDVIIGILAFIINKINI